MSSHGKIVLPWFTPLIFGHLLLQVLEAGVAHVRGTAPPHRHKAPILGDHRCVSGTFTAARLCPAGEVWNGRRVVGGWLCRADDVWEKAG